jgi:effector-binding domain-containing protein
MNVEISNEPLKLTIHGYAGVAANKDYSGTAFRLMDKMWQVVRSKQLENKGMNIWVYEPDQKVFAGVQLTETTDTDTGLEQKEIHLLKYARCMHTGPYHLIKQTGQHMREELKRTGFEVTLPYIEIYGHWDKDESKLETELIMALA